MFSVGDLAEIVADVSSLIFIRNKLSRTGYVDNTNNTSLMALRKGKEVTVLTNELIITSSGFSCSPYHHVLFYDAYRGIDFIGAVYPSSLKAAKAQIVQIRYGYTSKMTGVNDLNKCECGADSIYGKGSASKLHSSWCNRSK